MGFIKFNKKILCLIIILLLLFIISLTLCFKPKEGFMITYTKNNYDCAVDDNISAITGSDLESCQKSCTANSSCKGYSWNNQAENTPSFKCILKSKDCYEKSGKITSNNGWNFYSKNQGVDNYEKLSHDCQLWDAGDPSGNIGDAITNTNLDYCKNLCSQKKECQGISYTSNEEELTSCFQCILKSNNCETPGVMQKPASEGWGFLKKNTSSSLMDFKDGGSLPKEDICLGDTEYLGKNYDNKGAGGFITNTATVYPVSPLENLSTNQYSSIIDCESDCKLDEKCVGISYKDGKCIRYTGHTSGAGSTTKSNEICTHKPFNCSATGYSSNPINSNLTQEFGKFYNSSESACASQCNNYSQCVGYYFDKYSNQNVCRIFEDLPKNEYSGVPRNILCTKSSSPVPSPAPKPAGCGTSTGSDVYEKNNCNGKEYWNFSSYNYTNKGNISESECSTQCASNENCDAYLINPDNNDCFNYKFNSNNISTGKCNSFPNGRYYGKVKLNATGSSLAQRRPACTDNPDGYKGHPCPAYAWKGAIKPCQLPGHFPGLPEKCPKTCGQC